MAKNTDRERQYARNKRAKRQAAVADLKEQGCLLCPEAESCCLDFHHVDATTKSFGISWALLHFGHTIEEIRAEIEDKCIVLCKNCHAKLEAGVIDLDTI